MSDESPRLVISGSTGRLGGRIAARLAENGVPQRLLVRDAARAPSLPKTAVVTATYADTAAMTEALRGADVALMVSAAEEPNRVASHRSFVDAAVAGGVRHLVYTSYLSAAPDATFTLGRDHYATEEYIKASGMTWTFLRDNLYADFIPLLVGEDGVIRGPAGDGRVSFVAQDDIADAIVAVLTDPSGHANRSYDLTGPSAISMTEAAALLTAATGLPVTFANETVEEAYRSRAGYSSEQWQLDAWVSTYTSIAAGDLESVSLDLPLLAGHPSLTVAEVLQLWRSAE